MHSFHMMYSAGWQHIAWCTPFSILNQSVVPWLVLTSFMTCIQASQEAGKVVWYSQLFKNFPHSCDPQSQRLSVQFSRSVMSNSLRPHELQHARPPCPSPTPRVHPNSCASSQWCHPTISSSVVPFSSCPQSFPASGSFQMSQLSQLVAWGGQTIGVLASTSVLPMNTQDWSALGWTSWISLQRL